MHYELATEYSDFASWVWNSLYDPHGPVHVWLGGVLDCEETYREIGHLVGQEIAKDLAYISFYHRKNLFRDGIFKCEGNADVKSAPEEVRSWYGNEARFFFICLATGEVMAQTKCFY